jgi:hypothetical protein
MLRDLSLRSYWQFRLTDLLRLFTFGAVAPQSRPLLPERDQNRTKSRDRRGQPVCGFL